ncbi:ESX secretion-associated protein EspG [Nocardia sp. NBC_00511]|uniref:ESX secretion-associated protein EspG n=1 Tax=Nocardia sp. NBC_00511 TaxID=2903591 RepID=UPI0030E5856E
MTEDWQFSEAEFYVLWMDQSGEEPPDPFMFTSATRTAEDFDAELRNARESLSHKLGPNFRAVFDAMADPDLYLTAYGWNEQDRWSTGAMVRVRALCKAAKGYVITQLPGATLWRRGGYTVTECDPALLSAAVVAALPSAERGRQGDIPLVTEEEGLDHIFGHSRIAADSGADLSKTKEFLTTPATTAGEIHIVQGRSAYGPRGITRHLIRFRDLEDDGRYALVENPAQALAVDEPRFASILDDCIERVLRTIEDERN